MRLAQRLSKAFACAALCASSCKKDPPPAPSVATTSSSASSSASASQTAIASPITGPSADVTSHASPTYEKSPPVEAKGRVDGDALRARNKARLSVASDVTLLRGGTARELGERICEAVVPKRPKETPVLLKPNLGGFDWFKDPAKNKGDNGVAGRITDPEFVRGVIACLKKRGHTQITIAEGWGATHKDWEHLIDVSGYAAMAREEKVALVAMDDDGVFDVEGDTPGKPVAISGMEKTGVPTLLMPKLLADHLDHGLYLSLPKVKNHRFAVMSMGVKGMQGTVMLSDAAPAFRQKFRMHRELGPYLDAAKKKLPEDRALYVSALETFAGRIADVLEIEAPDAVLADGAPIMEGDGFQKLFPSEEMVAIGGTNAILVDRVGAQLLGVWDSDALAAQLGGHRTSPLLEAAAKRFGLDITTPTVVGDGADILRGKRPVHFVAMAPFTILDDANDAKDAADTKAGNDAGALPTVHAAALGTAEAIAIDGRPDDAAWARATDARWTTDFAGNDASIETRVRFVWSKDGLYALWTLSGAGLHVDATKSTSVDRPKLYEEDCTELFFTPDPSRRDRYFEIEVGPLGHFLDLSIDRAAKTNDVGWSAWSSGPKIATTHDEAAHAATIEYELTSKDVVAALTSGAALPLGLFRTEGLAPRAYLAWSPPRTKKPNFHVPAAFGTLVLDP